MMDSGVVIRSIGSSLLLKGEGVGGVDGAVSKVFWERIVEVLTSETLLEIDGAGSGVGTITGAGASVGIAIGATTGAGEGAILVGDLTEGEVAALASAAERAFCSAVIPSCRRGTAGGLSNERLSAGVGLTLIVVVVDETVGLESSTFASGAAGSTFEKRERPLSGVSGIDAMINECIMKYLQNLANE